MRQKQQRPRIRWFWRCLRRQEGAAMVEFALILPVFLILVLGGMDLGHMFYVQHLITNASREGARFGAKYTGGSSPAPAAISTYIKSASGMNYDSFKLDGLTVTAAYSGTSPNRIVTVTVQANKNWWILGMLPGFSSSKQLQATTAMVVEGP